MNSGEAPRPLSKAETAVLENAKEAVSLEEIIEQLKDGTYMPPPELSNEALEERIVEAVHIKDRNRAAYYRHAKKKENRQVWLDLKEERNAHVAIIIETIHKRLAPVLEQMKEDIAAGTVPTLFTDVFEKELKTWQLEEQQKRDSQEIDEEVKRYQRFIKIIEFGTNLNQWNFNEGTGTEFIMRGMKTAHDTLFNFFLLVPAMLERANIELTSENMEATIRKSYPFFIQMASQNLAHGPRYLAALERWWVDKKQGKFNPSLFSFEKQGDAGRIYVSKETTARLGTVFGRKIAEMEPSGKTTYCPVRYAAAFFRDMFEIYLAYFLLARKQAGLP